MVSDSSLTIMLADMIGIPTNKKKSYQNAQDRFSFLESCVTERKET